MSFEAEKRDAMWLLQALEDGSQPADTLRSHYEEADPALVYLIIAWLRAHYRSHSAAEGVYGRIAALCQGSAVVDRKRKEGAEDPVAQWLEEAFDLRDLEREAFIDEVVEKLEG